MSAAVTGLVLSLSAIVSAAEPRLRLLLERGRAASDVELVALHDTAARELALLDFLGALLALPEAQLEAIAAGEPVAPTPAPPLHADYPALDRWRRAVLEGRPVSPELARAAAWECTALDCARAAHGEHAARARREARRALLHHRHPHAA